jgi:hypothetical protein
MREIKVNFARFYNRRRNRQGYFWDDRFKSVIVENGETSKLSKKLKQWLKKSTLTIKPASDS